MRRRIAVLPGDGIGPEIVGQALRVLDAVAQTFGHEFETSSHPMGGCAIDALGDPLPPSTLAACRESDAVLLGAVGGPSWDHLDGSQRPESGLLRLRAELGLYANLRPAFLHRTLRDASPLKDEITARGVDMVIVRELTGGIYFGRRGTSRGPSGREAFDTETYHEDEIRRIARVGFELARKRRRRVTSVDKANVLDSSRLWRAVVTETAADFPDVACEHLYVDNAAMQIIRDPSRFDVVIASNLFGDILSDEAAMLTGSIGLLPSASLNGSGRGLYEPIHGSAPDIAGQDRANPIATILSAAMMLRLSFALEDEAASVERAVDAVLTRNVRTPDIAGPGSTRVGTREMGRLIAEAVGR